MTASSELSTFALAVSPRGTLHLEAPRGPAQSAPTSLGAGLVEAFAFSVGAGLLYLGTRLLSAELSPSLAFGRDISRLFLGMLCRTADLETRRAAIALPVPHDELAALVASAPPMLGAEYLSSDALGSAWVSIEAEVVQELAAFKGPVEAYLQSKNPLWQMMGRVCFHLAENKSNERAPFAFLATYASRLSKAGRVQHAPLGRAIEEYAGAGKKPELLRLLAPVKNAAESSAFVRKLVDSGEVYRPLAWTPAEAHAFLKEAPLLEQSGVLVRVPDWWHARRPARPEVTVTIGSKKPGNVGAAALLDFNVGLSVQGEPISRDEWAEILKGADGLRLVKGHWVEVDKARLHEVLEHWERAQRDAERGGVSFLEGMRLLSGVGRGALNVSDTDGATSAWSHVRAGPWLEGLLADLQHPEGSREADPGKDLHGTLRPYQKAGLAWLLLLSKLGLGACLADDMGLGKTIQVLGLLLLLKRCSARGPHLLVVPASLLGNWRAEMEKFAPSLRPLFVHPSFMTAKELTSISPTALASVDLVVTTYGTLLRASWLTDVAFGLVVLDEAQAIKNPSAKQTRAVKALRSDSRVALTGTPVENQLGDLWSLFDFLCPGLLGSAKGFRELVKQMEQDSSGYGKLRSLVRPYILRRMKSDKSIAPDLPDKTEVVAYCPLSKVQAVLYAKAVDELAKVLETAEGIQRRGSVLAFLMRFKQICNHPSQWLGDGGFEPHDSGKLGRLRELCEPIASRQEKVLVFTQFREMTGPLASFLTDVFARPGLVLHGETAVAKRAALVADFQRDDGPPFFVLSLKAGGTGLNLTGASHVIHFDRWWNPAVENQATDRAYRIGQKKNVLVHKLVCRGTIEEKIDALIHSKRGLSEEILAGGGEVWLTELKSEDLLRLVSLDLHSALAEV